MVAYQITELVKDFHNSVKLQIKQSNTHFYYCWELYSVHDQLNHILCMEDLTQGSSSALGL